MMSSAVSPSRAFGSQPGLRAWHAVVLFCGDQVLTGVLFRVIQAQGTLDYDAEALQRAARLGADIFILLMLAVLAVAGEKSVREAFGSWKGVLDLPRFSATVAWYPFFAWSLFTATAMITAAYDPAVALARYGFSADNSVISAFRFSWTQSVPLGALLIFSVCVASPLVEEFVFRGVLFRQMAAHSGVYVSILITSTLFGIVHGLDPFAFIGKFVVSVVLCLLYARTGSVFAAAILHGTVNLLTSFIAPLLVASVPLHLRAELQTPLIVGSVLALTVVIWAASVLRNLRALRLDGKAAAATPQGVCRFL